MTGTDCEEGLMRPNNGNFTCGVVEGKFKMREKKDEKRSSLFIYNKYK